MADVLFINEYDAGDDAPQLPATGEYALDLSDKPSVTPAPFGATTRWVELYGSVDFAILVDNNHDKAVADPAKHVLPGGKVIRYRVRPGFYLSAIRAA